MFDAMRDAATLKKRSESTTDQSGDKKSVSTVVGRSFEGEGELTASARSKGWFFRKS